LSSYHLLIVGLSLAFVAIVIIDYWRKAKP
jgi:hypothetical protein